MSNAQQGLARLERWMQTVVTHPSGVETGLRSAPAMRLMPRAQRDLESVILPSRSQGSVERLGIYAHMYYARLLEVMSEEYPATRRLLGDADFDRACRRYIELHPSTERTLQRLSAQFPAFLSRHLAGRRQRTLAVDVSRIERAMEDVFDAPQAEPLTHGQVAAIEPGEWATVRLRLNPALRLLALRTPANEQLDSVRGVLRPRRTTLRPTHVLVHRHRYRVYRRTLDAAQYTLLAALQRGRPVAAAVVLTLGRSRFDTARQSRRLGQWFRDWAAAGIFCAIERPPA